MTVLCLLSLSTGLPWNLPSTLPTTAFSIFYIPRSIHVPIVLYYIMLYYVEMPFFFQSSCNPFSVIRFQLSFWPLNSSAIFSFLLLYAFVPSPVLPLLNFSPVILFRQQSLHLLVLIVWIAVWSAMRDSLPIRNNNRHRLHQIHCVTVISIKGKPSHHNIASTSLAFVSHFLLDY